MNTWFTLQVKGDDPLVQSRRQIALALWCNSTVGMLLQSNPASGVQSGRGGVGNKGMLEALATLDVKKFASWQMDETQGIWRDFQQRKFQPRAIAYGITIPSLRRKPESRACVMSVFRIKTT